ncbi:MAG: hypothetical protein ACPLTR_02780 [Thermacetogeniaceae bacterium]
MLITKITDGADAIQGRDSRHLGGYGHFAVKRAVIDTDNPCVVRLYGDFLLYPVKPRLVGFRLVDTCIELFFFPPLSPEEVKEKTAGEILHSDFLCWYCDEIPDWWEFNDIEDEY